MELSAIYHRPESEYAYLYKDKKLLFEFELRKGTLKASTCTMGTLLSLWRSFIRIQKKWSR
ncbi:TPA: alpha amylase N-terminal ig-like domain-containing protein [Streptococcus pneumoniae]|nr:neopullulanase [Streptococcus pneumoniae]HEU3501309.1 alpha amylase N-terminal ig-like domain-containing protein [Streptococcus pneumoniae]HEU3563756.1 alpha amylase N-terminal ig-like domain-containing protein [Streptococcus pneumoniae]